VNTLSNNNKQYIGIKIMKKKIATLVVGMGMAFGMLNTASAAAPDLTETSVLNWCKNELNFCLAQGGSRFECLDEYVACMGY
jgi:hypothetical protein